MFNKEVLRPILRSIEECSERTAFVINEKAYSYRELGEHVSKIRLALREEGCTNPLVGLVANDDIETYASIVALWLEGKAYVPLHPGWPLERCLDIVEQVRTDLILDSSAQTRYEGRVLMTAQLTYTESCLENDKDVSEQELAYILFTSGSTGKPKGVMLSRGNIGAFMESFWQTGISITCEDRCLQCFDLTFDVSVQSYLAGLTRGASVYTVPHGQIKYIYVANLIDNDRITFGAMAPSMLRYMKPYFDEIDATSMKATILTAEACPVQLMEEWYACASNTEIYDFYGPTETTIYATYYKLTKGGENKALNGIISIGRCMKNVLGIIVDENNNELPIGEKGELCLAGGQVTPGYWDNEERNRDAFFTKVIHGVEERFYHTGDLCYIDEQGDIMYSGRIDHQAKIQGYRVELGEIEHHARQFMKVHNNVCIAFENTQGLTEIAMFIEAETFELAPLVEYMRTKMPAYMIPGRFEFVPQFPLNSNDKIDKNKLKALIV